MTSESWLPMDSDISQRSNCNARLVYFEQFDDAENAIKREKRLKKWNRAWKVRLIEEHNPNWDDLYPGIAGPP